MLELQGLGVSRALGTPRSDPPELLAGSKGSGSAARCGEEQPAGPGVTEPNQCHGQRGGAGGVSDPPAGTDKALPGALEGSGAAALARRHTSRNRGSPDGFRALIFGCSP